jgi:hypothetical protein
MRKRETNWDMVSYACIGLDMAKIVRMNISLSYCNFRLSVRADLSRRDIGR